jgi:hypothetical protein
MLNSHSQISWRMWMDKESNIDHEKCVDSEIFFAIREIQKTLRLIIV